ncbi:MAG: zinc ribbon domain-containing protein [Turicibacter sp.]|nr:zinc ribbon domain-containing protein [Turicibacter sp.]
MSGWDELGNTLNDAARIGAKKAGKWFEAGKLHMNLANAELDLKEIYEKIGEEIYKGRVLDVRESPKIQDLLVKAARLEEKVGKLKDKIHQSEQGGICPGCFKKIEEGARFCPYCATPQTRGYKDRF